MTRCTYVECGGDATHPQVAKDGTVWADLCRAHNDALTGALKSGSPPLLLREWIRAQGGAKAAAERFK